MNIEICWHCEGTGDVFDNVCDLCKGTGIIRNEWIFEGTTFRKDSTSATSTSVLEADFPLRSKVYKEFSGSNDTIFEEGEVIGIDLVYTIKVGDRVFSMTPENVLGLNTHEGKRRNAIRSK